MEFASDAIICQIAIRRGLVPVDGLSLCAEIQRKAKREGQAPLPLEALLVERGLLGAGQAQALANEAARVEGRASASQTARSGSSSSGSHGAETPEPVRRERDGVSPGERLGPYEVVKRIAKGGMGAVFVANDRLTGARVALKVLAGDRAKRDPDAQRFIREARLACVLRHDGLVRGLGFGTDRGLRYFAMELVPGESLRQRLKRGALAWREAVRVGRLVAGSLAYVHARGVVHRDVKPDNVLLGEGPEGQAPVKLCDLGLARELGVEAHVTSSGAALGTPRYISPEQARGEKDVDPRSDVYSLGITLFHALTGQPPFPETSGILVMSRHIYDEVPDVRTLAPGIPETVALVVSRMTKKRREDRYASAADIEAALATAEGSAGSVAEAA